MIDRYEEIPVSAILWLELNTRNSFISTASEIETL